MLGHYTTPPEPDAYYTISFDRRQRTLQQFSNGNRSGVDVRAGDDGRRREPTNTFVSLSGAAAQRRWILDHPRRPTDLRRRPSRADGVGNLPTRRRARHPLAAEVILREVAGR